MRVGAAVTVDLDTEDALVLAHVPVQDAIPDVDGVDFGRPILEHAVGEPAGGSADVGAYFAAQVQPEILNRPGEFLPAARYEARAAVDFQHDLIRIRYRSFGDHLAVGAHLPGHHQPLSQRTALGQAAFHQEEISPGLFHRMIVSGNNHQAGA